MSSKLTRRDFLKFGGLSLASLAFSPLTPSLGGFDDSDVVRVATDSVSVYREPSDKSIITGTWYRDDLVHIYGQVTAEEPTYNPVWYRVWGGYMHRARLQRVKILYNLPLDSIPEGERRLVDVSVPFTQPYRYTKTYGWQVLNPRLYYGSVHWVDQIVDGPDGTPYYRIFDELTGNYFVPAIHLRPIPHEEITPISPELSWEDKHIEVNLTTQVLTAYEKGSTVFQTNISSGLPNARRNSKEISTKTPDGKFNVQEKMPSKHMGNGNLLADADGYELPGVPWTCFFEPKTGVATHGTYWHRNYGVPMSHGCVNFRTEDAGWLYDFLPLGALVNVHY